VRPTRLLAAAAFAVAALTTACAKSDSGSGTPAGAGGPAATTGAAPQQPAENGVDKLTGAQILTKAQAALARATTVHITGSGFSGGEQIAIDLRLARGQGGTGTLTLNGQTVGLTRVGKALYMKADAAFWNSQTHNPNAAKLLGGKYVKVPANNADLQELASFTDLAGAAKDLLGTEGTVTKGRRTTINGVPVISLIDHSSDGGTLYIALVGEPYPLRLVPEAGKTDDKGTLEFVDYGKPFRLVAPPDAETIDLSQLGH
jgi:hypothetical protein